MSCLPQLFMMFVLSCVASAATSLGDAMEVRSGRDFATALSSSPRINVALVLADVWLREADFEGLLPYNGNATEPILLSRNFTILGSPLLPSWPLLNLGFVHDKIRIGSGVTLMARHVVVGDFRSGLVTQAPGFDLAAPTFTPTASSTPGLLLHNETAVLYSVCFPKAVWLQSVSTAVRPPALPGTQQAQMGVPQDGCTPAEAQDADRPSTGDAAAVGQWLLSRCWADRGLFVDLGFVGADVDKLGKLTPNNYAVSLQNVTYLCANVMSLACIQQLSPLGCALSLIRNYSASGQMPWQHTPEQLPPPLPQQPNVSPALPPVPGMMGASGSGRGIRTRALGAALGGGLGGALIVVVVVGAIVWTRRGGRRGTAYDASGPPSTASGKRVAECSVELGQCGCGEEEGGSAEASRGSGRTCPPLLLLLLPGPRPDSRSRQATATPSFATSAAPVTRESSSHCCSQHGKPAAGDGAGGGGGDGELRGKAGFKDHMVRGAATGNLPASTQDTSSPAIGSEASAPAGTSTRDPRRLTPHATPPVSQPSSSQLDPHGPAQPPPPVETQAQSRLLQLPLPYRDEDEHMVVSPFTPPRPGLALGRAAAEEVTLLPTVRGRGTYGRVYEGLYRGERVAVKIVREVAAGEGANSSWPRHARETFAQEVEVLGRCEHPNVVRLLAACLQPPRICLVMELMETSLEKLVCDRPPGDLLPLPTVLHIAIDVARGLEYLHPTILHRDLKPANILINNRRAERPTAKITDFGVSRLRSTILVTQQPEAGTPAYMAPETFDVNNYTFSHHVDIFSFGVCMWVMLTGKHPWSGFSVVDVAYKVTIKRERLPLNAMPPGRCPPRLAALLTQCWEHEPRRRPAAAELVKELRMMLVEVQARPAE